MPGVSPDDAPTPGTGAKPHKTAHQQSAEVSFHADSQRQNYVHKGVVVVVVVGVVGAIAAVVFFFFGGDLIVHQYHTI